MSKYISPRQVIKWYKLKTSFPKTYVEKSSNIPFLVGDLQLGKFDFLLIMPSTSNTVVKIATGISDTLLSNAAA
jgi:flavoprotein